MRDRFFCFGVRRWTSKRAVRKIGRRLTGGNAVLPAAHHRRAARPGRDVRVCVRFSTTEFAALFARVGRAAGSISEYVRRVTLGRRVPARVDVATAEGLMSTLAALRVALAMRELPAREVAVRSALVRGERVLAALLGPQGRSQ